MAEESAGNRDEKQRAPYPCYFSYGGLCGPFIQDSISFPAGIGRGAGFDPELEEQIAEIVSRARKQPVGLLMF